jgi:hypothetical protein
MPFYLYKREQKEVEGKVKECFEKIREVKIAGYNTLYNCWTKKGKPVNLGWHITIDDLVKELTDGSGDISNFRLIIDFDPRADWRIGLVEVIDIYIFTDGDENTGKVTWSPLMLRLRGVYYKKFENKISLEEKKRKINAFCVDKRAESEDEDIFEFLYLQGDERGWNWGRVGQVNATFIEKEPRHYFKKFFCK